MGAPFWMDNPDAWDKPVIGEFPHAIVMPGLSKVKGKGLAKLDKKSAPGASGGTITYLGADPAEMEITTTIWTKDQLQVLEMVLAAISPRPTKGIPKPVTIRHPLLQMAGIAKLFVSEIGMLEESPIRGAKEITIKFVQFFRPVGGMTSTNGKAPSVSLENLDSKGEPLPPDQVELARQQSVPSVGGEYQYGAKGKFTDDPSLRKTWPPSKTNGKP